MGRGGKTISTSVSDVASREAQALGFLACPPEDLARFATNLVSHDPRVRWDLVCFCRPTTGAPSGARFVESTGGFALPLRLWWRSIRRPYEITCIASNHPDEAAALRPLIVFVGLVRARARLIVDTAGTARPLPRLGRASCAWLATTPLLFSSVIVTWTGLKIFRKPPRTRRASGDRTAIVIPVLPDLSHTFVYR